MSLVEEKRFNADDVAVLMRAHKDVVGGIYSKFEECMSSVKDLVTNSPYFTPRAVRRSRQENPEVNADDGIQSPTNSFSLDESEDATRPSYPTEFRNQSRPVDGRDMIRSLATTTTRKRNGQITEWMSLPALYFSNPSDVVKHFKAHGWRLEKGNKVGNRGQRYFNFYCFHGGDSHKMHKKTLLRELTNPVRVKHRMFGDPACAPYCCPARLSAVFYPETQEVAHKITKIGHNHSADRDVFSMKIAMCDNTLKLMDIIVRDARDNPSLRTNDLFVHFMRSVDTEYPCLSAEQREDLKDIFGLIKRDLMKEVTELVRRARSDDKRLDLEILLQLYTRDLTVSGEHSPRLIGITFDYSSDAILKKLCVVISTTTMLRRAYYGHNQALLIDGTHQTNTAGYKVISLGTEDRWRRFHLIAVAITTEESGFEIAAAINCLKTKIAEVRREEDAPLWKPLIIMADGSSAITSAAIKEFPDALRLNCFYHIKAGFREKFSKFLSDSTYHEIQDHLSILAGARSKGQFDSWVSHFLRRWGSQSQDVKKYFSQKLRSDQWQSNFYWGAAGLTGLANSRTNNGTESFNKALRNTWLKRSICSLPRLIGVFKSEQMQIESREGYKLDDFDPTDFYHHRLLPYWRVALSYIQSDATRHCMIRKGHWAGDSVGELYAVGYNTDDDILLLDSGDYDPLNPPSGFLVFIPDSIDEILLPPPIGSACTCSTFMKKNFCDHIFFSWQKWKELHPLPVNLTESISLFNASYRKNTNAPSTQHSAALGTGRIGLSPPRKFCHLGKSRRVSESSLGYIILKSNDYRYRYK